MNKKKKILFKAISLVLVLLISFSTVAFAIVIIEWPDELIGFEEYNPVYTEFVEPGTAFEETTLPESVRGFVEIPEDMDVSTFVQVEPTVDSSTGNDYYDYYDYGYIQPIDYAENYAMDELVIYSIYYADEDDSGVVGEIQYRIYGYLEGSTTVWFTCDADGTITGAILDVPVDWIGDYDDSAYGTYTFQAVISEESSYIYKGEMPTAEIVVYDIDSIDCGHDYDCDCYTESTDNTDSTDSTTLSSHISLDLTDEVQENSLMYVDETEVEGITEISDEKEIAEWMNSFTMDDSEVSTMSNEIEISTMSLNNDYLTNSYTELYGDGTETIMADLISKYVTASISSSGNTATDHASGGWIDYLNTTWYNIVGAITTSTDSGETENTWTSKVIWVESGTDSKWYGTGQDSNDLVYPDSTPNMYRDDENTWYVWVGEQLLYALENYNAGDTILLCSDIDLNGQYYCWPDIELNKDLTINGNNKTIYNLSAFIDYSDKTGTVDTRSGFLSFSDGNFKIYDLNFDTGKIYADTTDSVVSSVNLSLFGIEAGVDSISFDDIHIDNYLVCSNSDAVSVFISAGLSPDWETTTDYTTGYSVDSTGDTTYYTSYQDYLDSGDTLDDYIEMDTYNFRITAKDCSVANSYVYGNDHVGSMGSYTSMSFTNCYAVGNIIVGTGYHSGAFVSCLNNAGYFKSCFAADNYLYSAAQSGGFVGYSGDSADYVDCYASGVVEGYEYIGGFVGATRIGHDYVSIGSNNTGYALSSRNYCTFTNCYSTTLVGMRTETNNSGGFVGLISFMGDYYDPKSAAIFDSCYAAGEVGSTQTVNETNTEQVGGFVGYDSTYANEDEDPYGTFITKYINCYYDKQTTAMREWVSGRYNSTDATHLYDIDITGVLTSNTEKYGTGLASGDVGEAHTEEDVTTDVEFGFIGFTNDADWEYTEEHYPQLAIFAEATSTDWSNPDLVKAYSLASTATVILDTWDYGYNWDEYGIRSESEELYSGTFETLADHIGDRYTYDTVREVVSNASITDSAIFSEMVEGGILTQSYMYDEKNEIEYDASKNILNKDVLEETKYNGINAFTLDNDMDSLTVDAPGIDWYSIIEESGGETGSRPIRLISFMKVDAGEDQVFTASDTYDHKEDAAFTMIDTLKENMVVSLDADEAWSTSLMQSYPDTNAFYQVLTESTQFTASSDAWVNTEIWRADLVVWNLADGDFVHDLETDMYYTETDDGKQWFYIGQDGVIYYEDTDGSWAELYASEPSEDGTVSYYTAEYSVKVNGTTTGDDMTTTQEKWNGEIPLYPELADDQYYVVRYYWVLDNGRYRSDYKIIEVTSDPVDIGVEHDVTIRVFNEADNTENSDVMAVYADTYDSTYDFSTTTSSYYQEEDVAYGADSYVSWNQLDENAVVTKTVLTMTSNNGYVVGTVETPGEISVGDTITIPIETFYIYYSEEHDLSTQSTESVINDLTYTVKEDVDGGLYLAFDNTTEFNVNTTSDTPTDFEIDDTHYNITFDIYVQEATEVTITKDVTGTYDETLMEAQSFIVNITGDLDTQVVLTNDETSKPIVTYLYEDEELVFYVEETVPMEFEQTTITYTIEGDDAVYDYDSNSGITVTEGDKINVIVTNDYQDEAYFKARDEVNNEFTDETE